MRVIQWSTGQSLQWRRPLKWMTKAMERITSPQPSKEQRGREMQREASKQSLAQKRWRWTEISVWEANSAINPCVYHEWHLDGRNISTWDHPSTVSKQQTLLLICFSVPLLPFEVFVYTLSSLCVTMMCFTVSKVSRLNKWKNGAVD